MKKLLVPLILLAMLFSLYACGSDTPETTTADEGASTAATEEATVTAEPLVAETPLIEATSDDAKVNPDCSSERDINKTEFVVYEDRIFFISKTSAELEAALADAMNTLFRSLPEEQNKYLMIVPTRVAYEVEEVQALSSDQKSEIKNIYMSIDPSVTLVDAYYALEQHAQNLNDLYFRTDHHWTHLGSYYAAQAFFEAAGMEYHPLGEYEAHDGGEFLGYLEDLANDPYFYDKPDTITYYLLPDTNREEWLYAKNVKTGAVEKTVTTEVDTSRPDYDIFLGVSGFSHAVVFGDDTSDRSLLLIGYSYSNAIATWFADSFKTVIMVDPRYYEDGREGLNELMDEYGVTDILLLISTSDSAALVDNFSNYIGRLIQ